jgi:hypothetical protein
MTREDSPSREQRRYRRISENVSIEVSELTYPLDDAGGLPATGSDINEEGIRFAIDRPFAEGAVLQLRIQLVGWQRHKRSVAALIDDDKAAAPLTAVAEVVWCHPSTDGEKGHEVGVKFLNIYEDDYRALCARLKEIG